MSFQYSIRSLQVEDTDPEVRTALLEERDQELEDYIERRLGTGTWSSPMRLGNAYLWVDATGDLRIDTTQPTTDLSGAVVGTQT